jgi:hypothetical protein
MIRPYFEYKNILFSALKATFYFRNENNRNSIKMKTKCIFSFYHSNINIIFVMEYHRRKEINLCSISRIGLKTKPYGNQT